MRYINRRKVKEDTNIKTFTDYDDFLDFLNVFDFFQYFLGKEEIRRSLCNHEENRATLVLC